MNVCLFKIVELNKLDEEGRKEGRRLEGGRIN
jgi:hypothetical protein